MRVLPPRGETARGNSRLWRVESFTTDESGAQLAQLVENVTDAPERRTALLDDLVVVAEFDDKIFPGLVETGRVERGGDKPFHTVINAENYHALEMLTYTHRGKVDAIYIDPPYNTGARDWKYNNDYVEGDDYRHSKWLAFMERRLLVARELLNPDDSVLVGTIYEKEYLRLGMLLEQTFPEAKTQMISSVINPGGSVRQGAFSRTDEYIFVLRIGESRVLPLPLPSDWRGGKSVNTAPVAWRSLLRGGAAGRREDRPNMFYPLFVSRSVEVSFRNLAERRGVADQVSHFLHGTVSLWTPISSSMRWHPAASPMLRPTQRRRGCRLCDLMKQRHSRRGSLVGRRSSRSSFRCVCSNANARATRCSTSSFTKRVLARNTLDPRRLETGTGCACPTPTGSMSTTRRSVSPRS